jgi:hypothetical protein
VSGVAQLLASLMTGKGMRAFITSADSGGNSGYSAGSFGAITVDKYQDGGGSVRTVADIFRNSATVVLNLSGASIPDTDVSFSSIVLQNSAGGTVTLARSARATYNGSASGGTKSQWTWTGVPTTVLPAGNAGPWSFQVVA